MYEPSHAPDLELSGKCGLLLDLVRSVLDAGEKVLVFSQYVSTLGLLEQLLAKHLFVTPAVLTGAMTVEEKDAAVQRFQARAVAVSADAISPAVQPLPELLRLFSSRSRRLCALPLRPLRCADQARVQRLPPVAQGRRRRPEPYRGVARHSLRPLARA